MSLTDLANIFQLSNTHDLKTANLGCVCMDTSPMAGVNPNMLKDVKSKAKLNTPSQVYGYYRELYEKKILGALLNSWNNGFITMQRGLPDPKNSQYQYLCKEYGINTTDMIFLARYDQAFEEIFSCFTTGITNNNPIFALPATSKCCDRSMVCSAWRNNPIPMKYVIKYPDRNGTFFICASNDILNLTVDSFQKLIDTNKAVESNDVWDVSYDEPEEMGRKDKIHSRTLMGVIHIAEAIMLASSDPKYYTVYDVSGPTAQKVDVEEINRHWQSLYSLI